MKKSSRKDREKAHAKADILRSAAAAFARGGYHGTTIEDVAREAGYSASSLYSYFKGKEDLYECLQVEVAAEFETVKADPVLPLLPFAERLAWLVQHLFAVVEVNRDFFVVFAAQHNGAKWSIDGGDQIAQDNYRNWVAFIRQFLEQGIRENAVRPTDAADLAYFAVGSINATVFRWVAGNCSKPLKDYVPTLVEFLIGGLCLQSTKGES